MSVSHTPSQALLRTLVMLNLGCAPRSTLLSVLSLAWFGVWDTDTVLHSRLRYTTLFCPVPNSIDKNIALSFTVLTFIDKNIDPSFTVLTFIDKNIDMSFTVLTFIDKNIQQLYLVSCSLPMKCVVQ